MPMLSILNKIFIWIKNEIKYIFSYYFLVQTSPMQCVDVMQLLAISDEGFLKSSGESTFVALCPSGTVWNDLRKAFCLLIIDYGQQSYDQQRLLIR